MEKIINFLLLLFLGLFPFGQLTRLGSFFTSQARLYLTDLVLIPLIISWLFWHKLKKKAFQLPPLAKPLLVFWSVAALSLFLNLTFLNKLAKNEALVASLYLFRLGFYFLFYFFLFDAQAHFAWLKRKMLQQSLIILGTIAAFFGLIQYFLWPDLTSLAVLNWDPHFYRVVGSFLDPGFSGLIYSLTLILLITLYWKQFFKKKILFLPLLLTYSALALTYSRSAYLAFLAGMAMIAFKKKIPRFFLTILLIGFLTILILPRQPGGEGVNLERTSTIQARLTNWQQSWQISQDNFFFGVGFNAYRYTQKRYGFLVEDWQVNHAGAGADSSLLFVFATTGIFGLIAYFWLWQKIFQQKRLLILASGTALLVHSLFLNSLFYPWALIWLAVILI